MKVQRTIAYLLGGAAAGGALFFAYTRFGRSGASGADSSSRKRSRDGDITLVRVTENGKKYHRENCPLLHGETRVIAVEDALELYEPCKACHPPGDLDVEEGFAIVGRTKSNASGSSGAASATSGGGTTGAASGSTASDGASARTAGDRSTSGAQTGESASASGAAESRSASDAASEAMSETAPTSRNGA